MLIVHLFVSYAHVNLCHFFSSSWCRGLAAASACGSSWTFQFTFLPRCNELGVISSSGVPTRTGFCLVTNLDLHLVILLAELVCIAAQTSVVRIAVCWKRIDLVGPVRQFGAG